jgi:hypothetical protein
MDREISQLMWSELDSVIMRSDYVDGCASRYALDLRISTHIVDLGLFLSVIGLSWHGSHGLSSIRMRRAVESVI